MVNEAMECALCCLPCDRQSEAVTVLHCNKQCCGENQYHMECVHAYQRKTVNRHNGKSCKDRKCGYECPQPVCKVRSLRTPGGTLAV